MKKKLVVRIILIVFISLLIGFGIYGAASNIKGAKGQLPFGCGLYVVESGSMEPAIMTGDAIFTKAQDEYFIGDIVVFTYKGSVIVHRIEDIDGDTVTTQGDWSESAAYETFPKKDIRGKVIKTIPKVGFVLDVVRSTPVTVALLVLAVYLYILSLRREKQEELDDKEKLQKEIDELKNSLGK